MLMTDLTRECPEPGVYEGVDFATYNSWDALSNSGLSLLMKSPRHFYEGERAEATEAMRIGELCHAGALEPASVAERYVVMPAFEHDLENMTADGAPSESKATKYYRQKRKEFEAANCGKEIVTRDVFESMMSLVRELSLNERANELLNARGPSEVSLVWDETVDGFDAPIRCKARLDKVALDRGAIVDLKKCRDVTRFVQDIAQRNYHRQLAFYQRGWAALHGGECLAPWLIAHETALPIGVAAAPLAELAQVEGGRQVARLLRTYAECRAAEVWPGLANPNEWELAAWRVSEVEPLVASDGREMN